MTAALLEISNVAKSFPGVRALDNVSFTLRHGEVLTLAGENGAGKSTLLGSSAGPSLRTAARSAWTASGGASTRPARRWPKA